MKWTLVFLFSCFTAFAANDGLAANFGLPLISKASRYYYVPQLKPEKEGGKSVLDSFSYSGSGAGYSTSISFFTGHSSCDWLNVVLVDKKTGAKKNLLSANRKIVTFLVSSENDSQQKIPQLILLAMKNDEKDAPIEFYIAKLDGSDMQRVSPAGKTVVSYDIDSQEKKLILLLRASGSGENVPKEAQPYLVDLKKISEAIAMVE